LSTLIGVSTARPVEHLVDIRLELPDTFADDPSHDNATFLVDLHVRCGWECYCGLVNQGDASVNGNRPTTLVERSVVHNLVTVLDELLTELFSKSVVLPEVGVHVLTLYCVNW